MMKKIMATMLCLTIATPSFAFCKHQRPMYHRTDNPHYTYVVYNNTPHIRHYKHQRISQRTKTLATVAGIAGAAAVISAIID